MTETTKTFTTADIQEKLSSSLWLRDSVNVLLRRDIIDAENDVLALVGLQKLRLQDNKINTDEYHQLLSRIQSDYAVSYWLKNAAKFLDGYDPVLAIDEAAAIFHLFNHREVTDRLLN